jgi:murein peptide amidase A
MMLMADPATAVYPHKLRRLYWPFLALAEVCREVVGVVAGSFRVGGRPYTIPRFTFLGPTTNVPQKRIGFFALVHGDEPAGALALLNLLQKFAAEPVLAAGYDLVFYPVCNPTGYEAETRHNHAGHDLNREFWQGSDQPEIRILEQELETQPFDGIVALHADDTSEGLYGYAHGRELNEDLLVPALLASERVIPCNHRPLIDGFTACAGVIADCFKGVLRPSPTQHPQPFEIIFETPGRAAIELQAEAAQVAVQTILSAYRSFIAYAQDI